MSSVSFSFEHHRSLEEAKKILRQAIDEVEQRLPLLVTRVQWSPEFTAVQVSGIGFEIDASVDERLVHVDGRLYGLSRMLGGAGVAKVKTVLQDAFKQRLGAPKNP